ncbi:MAG: alpha-mannosidase [Sedimentisphaerales bacterium]|nr:alpha-mannosidase [Sedimentisphaerales bacterium]
MTTKKRNLHLICNAHLDPVWLWEWPEGAAEALSTFRTAAELCENNNTFVFNHNEVILYQWVKEYEPALFQRIQKLVKAGRWHIMGGWYLQPDCNMPSGESFIRQILLGKKYFKENFGVNVTTAINFDPFGHTRGLAQILARSGYDSYLFGRPDAGSQKLPGEEFIWVGYDGSEILAIRFPGWYNTQLGKARKIIEDRFPAQETRHVPCILWGVGNHGGGPSRHDLKDVNQLIQQNQQFNILHSTPEAVFKELKQSRDKLPQHKGDLNPWAIGCYTSQIRIKQKHRQLENELYATEKMASAAAIQKLIQYPQDDLDTATQDLATTQFHDILPGSAIQPVEEAALRQANHGLEIINRIKTRTFFALAAGQPQAKSGQIPVLVYNPHPFPVKTIVECEFNLADQNYDNIFVNVKVHQKGKLLPCQVERELSNIPIEWRKRVVFTATLQPSRMNRFDCDFENLPAKPKPKFQPKNNKITFKTPDLRVVINTRTGLIDKYQAKGADYLAPNSFLPLVIKDNEDPWGMHSNSFPKVTGKFKLASQTEAAWIAGLGTAKLTPVRVIEDGPVRTVIEALFTYGHSFICQQYHLPKQGTQVQVDTRVHWNEKDHMLKLQIATLGKDSQYLGQVAAGVAPLPNDGREAVAQKWVAVTSKQRDAAVTCVNDGIYGSSFNDNNLRLTLLRSPAYSAHPINDRQILPKDRYTPRIDQGERFFRFWFDAGKINERLKNIDREAIVQNEKPMALSFYPPGIGQKPKPALTLSDPVVQLMAFKKAENHRDYIIRVFEPTGRKRATIIEIPPIRKKIKVKLNPFEIKTIRVSPNGKHTFTNLMEKPITK